MLNYKPVIASPVLGRVSARPLGQAAATPVVATAPPPGPDPLFTGYTGIPGLIEAALVLTVTASATWLGLRTALAPGKYSPLKVAGWIGGIGAGAIGILYVAGKSGLNMLVGLPAVRVTPS